MKYIPTLQEADVVISIAYLPIMVTRSSFMTACDHVLVILSITHYKNTVTGCLHRFPGWRKALVPISEHYNRG